MPGKYLRLNRDDAEADVVVAAVGLETQTEGGAAGPAVVGPGAAAADAGIVAGAILLGGGRSEVEIGVDAAGQLDVIPIAAPFKGVAVHVVEAPGIGRIAADVDGMAERWSGLAAVVGTALE